MEAETKPLPPNCPHLVYPDPAQEAQEHDSVLDT